ncbi:MAG: hypothetical protein KC776_29510 [Myxococcales bacterium]|nr:hypothetical protein [Myxococcales bacterium]
MLRSHHSGRRRKEPRLQFHVLNEVRYEVRDASVCLAGLAVRSLEAHLEHPTLTQAIKAFRASLAEA